MDSVKINNDHEKNIIFFLNNIHKFSKTCPNIDSLYKMLCIIYDNFISFNEYK